MALAHREGGLQSPASQRLRDFLRARPQAWQQGEPEVEQFERELHEQIMNLERAWVAEELARYDVAAERIEGGGVSYPPVWQAAETSLSAAGPVRVERPLYRPAGSSSRSGSRPAIPRGRYSWHGTPQADTGGLCHRPLAGEHCRGVVSGTGGDAAVAQHLGSAAAHLVGPLGSPPRRLGSRPPSAGSRPDRGHHAGALG